MKIIIFAGYIYDKDKDDSFRSYLHDEDGFLLLLSVFSEVFLFRSGRVCDRCIFLPRESEIRYSFLCSFGNEKFPGIVCLMDCAPSSSDKKTLKRWFFIDKRVG
nr:hypothetical protein CFP56_60903 [Quercus suber]